VPKIPYQNTYYNIDLWVWVLDEALLAAKCMAKGDGPLARDMACLRLWMQRTDMGYVYLLGADSDVYEKPELGELITVKRHEGHNLAARVMADFAVRMWRKMFRVVSKTAHVIAIFVSGFR
jgi:hypothetical protein